MSRLHALLRMLVVQSQDSDALLSADSEFSTLCDARRETDIEHMEGAAAKANWKTAIDETGKTFGRWTVLRRAGSNRKKKAAWLCRCSCGVERVVCGRSLRAGRSKSCGCNRFVLMPRFGFTSSTFVDLTGRRFGMLIVLGKAGTLRRREQRYLLWVCRCDCGAVRTVRGMYLRYGQTTHCGCKGPKPSKGLRKSPSKRPEHQAWQNMMQRCNNPKHPHFRNYGGRGVTVCAEWQQDFAAFYAHVGPRPGPEYTLDRKDNSRGYEPGNVRWATRKQQQENRRPHTRWPLPPVENDEGKQFA